MPSRSARFVGSASIAALCLTLRLAIAAGNFVEFSAALQNFTSEGVTYRRLVFKDDKQIVFYQPPADWKCNVASNQLTLVPSDRPFAEGKISSSPLERPVGSDDRAAAAFKEQVFGALPPGNQHAVLVKQEQNAVLLNNNPTLELIASYDAYGQSFQRGVLVVNTPTKEIRFQFTARKSDFEPLYRAFRASALTWEWHPEPEQGASE